MHLHAPPLRLSSLRLCLRLCHRLCLLAARCLCLHLRLARFDRGGGGSAHTRAFEDRAWREALAEAAAAFLYDARPVFEAHGTESYELRSDVANTHKAHNSGKLLLVSRVGAVPNDEGAVTKKLDHTKGVEPRGRHAFQPPRRSTSPDTHRLLRQLQEG
eukprot:scaffold22395_cov61-Phaeocystis_antarctica.AAC.4